MSDRSDPNTGKSSKSRIFATDVFWVSCFILARLLLIVTIGFKTRLTEETYIGSVADYFLRNGISFSGDYQFVIYGGGNWVVAVLVSGLFRLFGANIFSLKLSAVLFVAAALWIWRLYFRNIGHETAGLIFTLLMILSPPFFLKISCVSWGLHVETTCLLAGGLFLFDRMLRGRHASVYAFGLGLLSGFSVYFLASYLLLPASFILVLLLHLRKHPDLKKWVAAVPGFLIGVIPWFIVNLANDFRGLYVFKSIGIKHVSPYDKIIRLWTVLVPDSTGFPSRAGIDTHGYGIVYMCLGLALAAGVLLSPAGRRSVFSDLSQQSVFIYILLFTLVVGFSSFKFNLRPPPYEFRGYRYLAPVYPMFFFVIALGTEGWFEIFRRKSRRWIVVTVLSTMLIMGGISLIRIVFSEKYDERVFKPYNWADYRKLKRLRMIRHPGKAKEVLQRTFPFKESDRIMKKSSNQPDRSRQ